MLDNAAGAIALTHTYAQDADTPQPTCIDPSCRGKGGAIMIRVDNERTVELLSGHARTIPGIPVAIVTPSMARVTPLLSL